MSWTWQFPCSSLLSLKLRSPVNQRRWRVAPDHSVQHYDNYWCGAITFMFSLSSSDAYHVFSAPFCRIEKRSWWPQLIPLQLWKLLKLHREQKLIGLHAPTKRNSPGWQKMTEKNPWLLHLWWRGEGRCRGRYRSFSAVWTACKYIIEYP